MDNDDDSRDYSYGKFSDSYGGLGLNSPSFSNDVSNIKNTINKSRAEQTSSNRGVVEDEDKEKDKDDSSNGRESELGQKENIDDKKDDKTDTNDAKESKDNKKDSDKGKGGKKFGGLPSKGDLNPIKKIKGKFNLLKIKLIMIGVGFFVAFAMIFAIVGTVGAMLGLFNDSPIEPENINVDDYDIRSDSDTNQLLDDINNPYEEEEEETGETENTGENTSDAGEETNDENNTEDETNSDANKPSNNSNNNNNNNEIEHLTE